MKKTIFLITIVLCSCTAWAQEILTPIESSSYSIHDLPVNLPIDSSKTRIKALESIIPPLPDPVSYWSKENELGIIMSQIAFSNWNAGGNNAISGISSGRFVRWYKRGNVSWNNELILKFGLNAQENQKLRKSDDAIQFNSTFGYRTHPKSNWYYSAKLTFSTQFTNGYQYPGAINLEMGLSRSGY